MADQLLPVACASSRSYRWTRASEPLADTSVQQVVDTFIRSPDSAELWGQIEAALRLKNVDASLQRALLLELGMIARPYFQRANPSRELRPPDIRRALDARRRDAARLFLDLEPRGELWKRAGTGGWLTRRTFRLEDPPTLKPEERGALHYIYMRGLTGPARSELLVSLAEEITKIDKVTKAWPVNKRGRKKNFRLHRTIQALAALYKEKTGEKPRPPWAVDGKPPTGAFYRLVEAFLQIFAPKEITSPVALAKTIQRVLDGDKTDTDRRTKAH